MGTFKFAWEAKDVPLDTKVVTFSSKPLNLLLCSGDDWSDNMDNFDRIEMF